MFILMSIHHPRPEHEAALIASMHRYGNAIREDFERLAPADRAAVKDDPFDVWEKVEIDWLMLVEV